MHTSLPSLKEEAQPFGTADAPATRTRVSLLEGSFVNMLAAALNQFGAGDKVLKAGRQGVGGTV